MAAQTLAEAQKLIRNQIVQGVVRDIVTINPMYDQLPFVPYTGQALLVNRENALGDAGMYAVDATITNKAAATFTQVPFTATKIIGDAEMDGLVKAQSASAGVDQLAVEVSSKARSVGRLFQQGIATGTGTSPQMNSLHSQVDATQFTTASAGQALSFALLDELLDLIKAKDGVVDWIMMPARTLRSYKALVRALNGTPGEFARTTDTGRVVDAYNGIPIFKNEWLSVVETANGAALTGGALTSVWAGCWDDGSGKVGVAGIYPEGLPTGGFIVENIGKQEAKDNEIVRVKQYANFAVFNRRSIGRLPSINN